MWDYDDYGTIEAELELEKAGYLHLYNTWISPTGDVLYNLTDALVHKRQRDSWEFVMREMTEEEKQKIKDQKQAITDAARAEADARRNHAEAIADYWRLQLDIDKARESE